MSKTSRTSQRHEVCDLLCEKLYENSVAQWLFISDFQAPRIAKVLSRGDTQAGQWNENYRGEAIGFTHSTYHLEFNTVQCALVSSVNKELCSIEIANITYTFSHCEQTLTRDLYSDFSSSVPRSDLLIRGLGDKTKDALAECFVGCFLTTFDINTKSIFLCLSCWYSHLKTSIDLLFSD